jgi:hypothetical protein
LVCAKAHGERIIAMGCDKDAVAMRCVVDDGVVTRCE